MECLYELTTLAEGKGIEGNEAADELIRKGSANQFLGSGPFLGMSYCTA